MTIPRLNRDGRVADAKYRHRFRGQQFNVGTSRPSPAEKRKARHLAYRRAQRKDAKLEKANLHIAYLMGRGDRTQPGNPPGWRCPDGCTSRENPEPWCDAIGAHISKTPPSLPPSRGTTHGQLLQMYHESEQP